MPGYGYVVTRKDLDAMVAGHAAKAGATLWEHTEAVNLSLPTVPFGAPA